MLLNKDCKSDLFLGVDVIMKLIKNIMVIKPPWKTHVSVVSHKKEKYALKPVQNRIFC